MVSELTSDFAYCVKVETDGTLQVEWVTDAFTRITGYEADDQTEAGLWADLVHPDDLPVAQEHLASVLGGQVAVCEYRIVRRDGKTRWLREHARPAWDEDQTRVVRFYAAAQDITDRKLAHEEQKVLISELQDALARVKTLSGLLPICSSCKKIRDDEGYWTAVEVYILERSEAQFSHGLCPSCAHRLYPNVFPSEEQE
jgi:PAS domain S-box-containing protein